ncbi:hypothetical protein IGB42_02377 [Andreprevotia sp. IGB-42]|uniref:hypothetical protein n=1 Tax=Andreprevotia sp. IGB-42 TaxID=2497473 RepID=UPI00135B69AF|nr:hypothetical protein [Andreprevotia sp. IGB-42]KAF0812981.1 hypothetical protein IGB42_02377 [Andreprevotia sp. IGB-42]
MTTSAHLQCLPLDSSRWGELEHAYGLASDIPELLRKLDTVPSAAGDEEPWFSLWSALAHQNDVYAASFAAVPHVVRALATAPLTADFNYFQFPAVVEAWRLEAQIRIPEDLQTAYFAALAALPGLVAQASAREWDDDFLACALSAVAAAKGFGKVAEAVLEMTPDVADEFLEWFHSL